MFNKTKKTISCDPKWSVWLSIDPLAETMPSWSSYNYTFSNPVKFTDPTGMAPEVVEENPVFGADGEFYGYTESGNTGVALIFDSKDDFTERMSDDKAFSIGNILDFGEETSSCLDKGAQAKIFDKMLDGIVFNNGTKYSEGDSKITTDSDAMGNARYHGIENGKHHVNFDIGEYEWTVENIRATFIHEIEGHGFNGYTDTLKNHHKAYFKTMDSKYWNGTTPAFKKNAVKYMYDYYFDETKTNTLPSKYYYFYKNNINNKSKWMR